MYVYIIYICTIYLCINLCIYNSCVYECIYVCIAYPSVYPSLCLSVSPSYIFIPISLPRERLLGNLARYSSLIRKPIIF